MSLDLEFLDGVYTISSPFAVRFPPSEGASKGTPVFGAQISDTYRFEIARFRALETGLPTLININADALLIAISIDLEQVNMAETLPLIIAEIESALPSGTSVTFTGEDVISLEIVYGLKDDLIALNLWGSLLVCFAAALLLRDLRMVALAAIPALLGASSVLALAVWLGFPINVLSNVIPILILVLGMADGVHLAGHLKASGDSVRETVLRIGPACALTALTTALAFACIMITSNEQLFEFAVLGALGTLLAFVVLITIFVLLAQVMRFSTRPAPRFAMQFAIALTQFSLRWPRGVILASAALLVISMIGYQQAKPWFPLYQNLPQGSVTLQTNDAIARDFGGVFQMIVDVKADWEQTTALVDDLAQIAGAEAVLSDVALARWLGIARAVKPDDLSGVSSALFAQLGPVTGVHRIFISVPEPMRDEAAFDLHKRLHTAASEGGATRIFGLPTVMRIESVSLISQLSRSLVLVSVLATLVVALAFGSLRLFPLLLMPNILPLMLTASSLHVWAAGEFSPTAVLALTITFGIAIDDSVHFLNRFYEARKRGGARKMRCV